MVIFAKRYNEDLLLITILTNDSIIKKGYTNNFCCVGDFVEFQEIKKNNYTKFLIEERNGNIMQTFDKYEDLAKIQKLFTECNNLPQNLHIENLYENLKKAIYSIKMNEDHLKQWNDFIKAI